MGNTTSLFAEALPTTGEQRSNTDVECGRIVQSTDLHPKSVCRTQTQTTVLQSADLPPKEDCRSAQHRCTAQNHSQREVADPQSTDAEYGPLPKAGLRIRRVRMRSTECGPLPKEVCSSVQNANANYGGRAQTHTQRGLQICRVRMQSAKPPPKRDLQLLTQSCQLREYRPYYVMTRSGE